MLEDIRTNNGIEGPCEIRRAILPDIPNENLLQLEMIPVLFFYRLQVGWIHIGRGHPSLTQQPAGQMADSTANLQDLSSQMGTDFPGNPPVIDHCLL